ncbi:nurim-like [Amphiura filiformis]|uniref:nurim-like n=1 Tax=Amphiura filiformis TaxID=82378 RepID=UPI003B21E713
MVNMLKSAFLFLVSALCFSICFTTVLQFALWLYGTGFSYTTTHRTLETDDIEKTIILHNLLLILVFVIQHSLMASDYCKHFFTMCKLDVLQRSIYVIATCAVLQVVMYYWLPLYTDHPVWAFDQRRNILWLILSLVHIIAWLMMFGVILVIDYGELIGVKQIYYFLTNSPPPMQMKSASNRRMFDNFRHPVLLGLLLVLWFVPVMTLDRLLLAIFLSLYTCLGHNLDTQDYEYLQSQSQQKEVHLRTQYSYWHE